ncbi:MAG TPA: L-fucose:H+ symporter permease [Coprobacter fastidiosus]|uniref:L-fucose:H+ symporter permease n=1 Tax=Coprobacter fastidiosus TaxID=1099853 RepID=A0A354M010_9BACT|nr:L-fucose:H+ symporter permease [Coprobacter fastidiosus]
MKNKIDNTTIFRTPDGRSYLVPFILVTSLFLLWGFAHGLLDVLNKHFQLAFTMTKAESGLVQFSTYIAYFLMAIPAGIFMKKYGYKKGIILGLLLFAIGAFSFIPAALMHSSTPFLIALFIIACGLCILETAANPYSTVLGPKESAAQRINLSQSFNGLGWILGPLVGGTLIFGAPEGDSTALTKPYILVGSIVLVIGILFFFTKLPEIKEDDEKTPVMTNIPDKSIWKHRHFVLAVIAQFAYCAAQTGIFSFFINYVTEQDPSIDPEKASRILAFGGMTLFMVGRLSGSILMKWTTPNKLLVLFSLISSVCMLLVILALGRISLYALYTTFFFMSIMFPTIFALGLSNMGTLTKKASSYIVMGVAGGAFSPMLMGLIGENNMAVGFIVPFVAFIYILFFAAKGYRS